MATASLKTRSARRHAAFLVTGALAAALLALLERSPTSLLGLEAGRALGPDRVPYRASRSTERRTPTRARIELSWSPSLRVQQRCHLLVVTATYNGVAFTQIVWSGAGTDRRRVWMGRILEASLPAGARPASPSMSRFKPMPPHHDWRLRLGRVLHRRRSDNTDGHCELDDGRGRHEHDVRRHDQRSGGGAIIYACPMAPRTSARLRRRTTRSGGIPKTPMAWTHRVLTASRYRGKRERTVSFTSSTYGLGVFPLNPSASVVVPALASPTATAITNTTATLGANITSNGGATLTARGTCWARRRRDDELSCRGWYCDRRLHAGEDGLSAGTLLYYRGYANKQRRDGYSPDGSFFSEPTTQAAS